MHPVLFEIRGFPVHTYGLLLAAAYLLGLQLAVMRSRRFGLDPARIMDLGIAIIIAALVGAKALLLIVEYRKFTSDPWEILTLLRSGGGFYGGLLVAVPFAIGTCGGMACRRGPLGTSPRPVSPWRTPSDGWVA